jgi:hypothetical protein
MHRQAGMLFEAVFPDLYATGDDTFKARHAEASSIMSERQAEESDAPHQTRDQSQLRDQVCIRAGVLSHQHVKEISFRCFRSSYIGSPGMCTLRSMRRRMRWKPTCLSKTPRLGKPSVQHWWKPMLVRSAHAQTLMHVLDPKEDSDPHLSVPCCVLQSTHLHGAWLACRPSPLIFNWTRNVWPRPACWTPAALR